MLHKKICFCLLIILVNKVYQCIAGSCYAKIDSNGKCSNLMANDVSKEECCKSMGIGYEEAISNEAIFMLHAGMKKENCKACKESCDSLNCGDAKRCIMKKGQPKCVCAPNCKVTATINNKNRKVGGTKRIAVIQLPEMKSANRHYSVVGLPIQKNSEMQNDEPTLIVANNRRNLLKKLNQSSDASSHLNTVQSLIPSRAPLTDNETRIMMEMKFRSGFFNDNNNIQMTSHYDEFYFGNIPKFAHYSPVCGSDGKTYKNECQLKKRACRQENKKLEMVHRGFCQSSCNFINCSNGKKCIEDHNFMPQCVSCPKCTRRNKTISNSDLKKFVCGVDGVSYRSVCELKQKSCKIGRSIQLAYRGPCSETLNCNQCSQTQKCLPDLVTNRPVCVTCNRPYGRCPAQRSKSSQVCGINNITYHSKCHLLKDSCNTGFYIGVKNDGPCKS